MKNRGFGSVIMLFGGLVIFSALSVPLTHFNDDYMFVSFACLMFMSTESTRIL